MHVLGNHDRYLLDRPPEKIELHQDLDGPARIERAAQHVAEIDDVGDALRADVGEHRLQREMVSVDVGNRGKTHQHFL